MHDAGGSSKCVTETDGPSLQCSARGKSPAMTLRMRGDAAAFIPLPLPDNTAAPTCAAIGFTIDLSFIIDPSCLDWCYDTSQGFTFSLVSAPAMGTGGNQLGFGGLSGLAVEFDSAYDDFDPMNHNHIGIDIGGGLRSVAWRDVPFNLIASTYIKRARIQLDPVTELMSVLLYNDYDSALDLVLTQYVDACSILSLGSTSEAPTLYVGFTSGTAASYATRYFIYDWAVTTGEQWWGTLLVARCCRLQFTSCAIILAWSVHRVCSCPSCYEPA